jgi:hypothetical protein
MKWCDLLRVKSEFPIKLWPNAVQAYHHWIHTAVNLKAVSPRWLLSFSRQEFWGRGVLGSFRRLWRVGA